MTSELIPEKRVMTRRELVAKWRNSFYEFMTS